MLSFCNLSLWSNYLINHSINFVVSCFHLIICFFFLVIYPCLKLSMMNNLARNAQGFTLKWLPLISSYWSNNTNIQDALYLQLGRLPVRFRLEISRLWQDMSRVSKCLFSCTKSFIRRICNPHTLEFMLLYSSKYIIFIVCYENSSM